MTSFRQGRNFLDFAAFENLAPMAGLNELIVLVIDDNSQIRTIVGTVLAAIGIGNLHYAQDGRRGLEAVADVKPDLVYVDYEMPSMGALEFIMSVRASDGPD